MLDSTAVPSPALTLGPPRRRSWANPATPALLTRGLRLSLRNIDGLITALALPVMLMLMFVYLFGGAIDTGSHYVDFVFPGVMLVCVGFGAGSTAVTVAQDMTNGVIDRLRSMDVSARSLINGHVVASVVRNIAASLVVFGVAEAIGFRSHAQPRAWLAAAAILALFVLALSWLAAAIGIVARSAEAANGIMFFVAFLPYPSSAFVPVSTMPRWMQGFARNQPSTQVIDTIRGLLDGGPVAGHAVAAVAWGVGIIVASVLAAGLLFSRRTT
jgi:ABC-2 type transport system permease protein